MFYLTNDLIDVFCNVYALLQILFPRQPGDILVSQQQMVAIM
jgi:hypothetical protein